MLAQPQQYGYDKPLPSMRPPAVPRPIEIKIFESKNAVAEVGSIKVRNSAILRFCGKRAANPTSPPLWVKSGHQSASVQCPLYPLKQTSIERVGMSALCR